MPSGECLKILYVNYLKIKAKVYQKRNDKTFKGDCFYGAEKQLGIVPCLWQ